MSHSVMTEDQLKSQEAAIAERLEIGEATVEDAEKLALIRRDLRRISDVRRGLTWLN